MWNLEIPTICFTFLVDFFTYVDFLHTFFHICGRFYICVNCYIWWLTAVCLKPGVAQIYIVRLYDINCLTELKGGGPTS